MPDPRKPSLSPTNDPWLLTPGPLTTSPAVKQAMLHDYGSRDQAFIAMNRRVRDSLVAIIDGQASHVCVPLQGSGTFAVEAMLGTLVPRNGKLLILVNGAYGHRMAAICHHMDRPFEIAETPENVPVDVAALDRRLGADPAMTHVALVWCETTTGLLNPLSAVADIVAQHGRRLLIDAMSAFAALPLSAKTTAFDAVAASSNKCLEGAPGMGFVLARPTSLEQAKGNSPSLSLDLHEQWIGLEKTQQWRFTPPTHVLAAFHQAIAEFEAEGGVAGRGKRYTANCRTLVDGLRAMGFQTLLPDHLQAPIIVTVRTPADPRFDFPRLYERVRQRGYVLYPGKLAATDSFRVGCIGQIGIEQIEGALAAIRLALDEMGVVDCAPPK
ncbi:MAG: 2-aminoethylphosphonate--pyruvate transaminase [Rhodospirillales bacterium]|nr:2-aminoethylphosphonate--pyruvate transaminase [Rhodospirillales bacterium]